MTNLLQKIALITIFCIVTIGFGIPAYYLYKNQNPEDINLESILVNKQDNSITKAFFSPDDHIKDILIKLIKSEKKKICIAIYTLTDKDIAQAIINAHFRGINIEVVTDRNYATEKSSRIYQLANHKLPVWVYQTSDDEKKASLMHDKFCIFFDNILNKTIIFTGSFNFTRRANLANQENIIILDNKEIIERFTNQFEILKKRSLLISGDPKKIFLQTSEDAEKPCWWHSILCWLKCA